MAATMAVTGGPIRPDRPEAAILAKLTNVKRTGWVTKLVQRRRPPGYRFRLSIYRGLTPLIYAHVNPYGRFDLDLNSRIDFDRQAA